MHLTDAFPANKHRGLIRSRTKYLTQTHQVKSAAGQHWFGHQLPVDGNKCLPSQQSLAGLLLLLPSAARTIEISQFEMLHKVDLSF